MGAWVRAHLGFPAAAALLLAASPAVAVEFGVGLEGGGTLTFSGNVSHGAAASTTSAGLGLVLEERFRLPAALELTIWEDAQLPFSFTDASQTTTNPSLAGPPYFIETVTAGYVPMAAGLRLGLRLPLVQPYVGILLNDDILTSSATYAVCNFVGLGGDLGLDFAVLFFRFGLDLRAFSSVTNVNTNQTAFDTTLAKSVTALQGFVSARVSF
jgi:hypothetical protein